MHGALLLSSQVVPGAGEPNFDSFETDIFASRKQRQESEVRQLLDKLQPDMITLDTNLIGTVDRASKVCFLFVQSLLEYYFGGGVLTTIVLSSCRIYVLSGARGCM